MPAMAGLFGTDGVRGVANRDLTPELSFSLGRALVQALGGLGRPVIVVGRDTRPSGPMLQAALSAGICSAGGDVIRPGVAPTPAVAFVTVDLAARAGAVISASHNPPEDNGIKFFSSEGTKLPDAVEEEIELTVRGDDGPRPEGSGIGRVEDRPAETERYLEHIEAAAETRLDGMRVVVDCGFGAAYRLAPEVLRRLGAEVHPINDRDEGERINVGCGATHPEVVATEVRRLGADAGVAHDGDADRAILCDGEGNVIDGDQVIVACALGMKAAGRLRGNTVVVTVMANLGLRRALDRASIRVLETPIGEAVRSAEDALGDRGRVLVRPSGTEPLVRVMVEAETESEAREHAGRVAQSVREALGGSEGAPRVP